MEKVISKISLEEEWQRVFEDFLHALTTWAESFMVGSPLLWMGHLLLGVFLSFIIGKMS